VSQARLETWRCGSGVFKGTLKQKRKVVEKWLVTVPVF
jgi:hypothetical protein